MRTWWAMLALLVAVGVVSCGGEMDLDLPDRTTRTIYGTLSRPSGLGPGLTKTCDQPGYSDITPGAQVTLTDSAGTIVGTARLRDTGIRANTATTTNSYDGRCTYAFDFPEVEAGSGFYSVEVTHRGKITKSVADLIDDGWTFDLTLGG